MSREEAIAAATAEADPSSLAAGERLRKKFGPELSAWALTQVELRRAAATKLDRASAMWFTRAGMEQATRTPVARWRAQRFVDAGVKRVWDVGCGIGSDAMAFAEAGLEVIAVDADPETVEIATHNLSLVGGEPARLARAEELVIPAEDAVFLDPARRTARGRTWNVADFTPPWELVLAYYESSRFVCVKLGPGVPKELLPDEGERSWVSVAGDVVEASIWNQLEAATAAVRLEPCETNPAGTPQGTVENGAAIWSLRRPRGGLEGPAPLPVATPGKYIAEPDGAALRAGLIPEAVGEAEAWLLADGVGYVSSDHPILNPWTTTFEVIDVLPYDRKVLQRYVREHAIGTLEIKKRAIDVDPAQLRKQLKPKGPNAATIILTPTIDGARVIVAKRLGKSGVGR